MEEQNTPPRPVNPRRRPPSKSRVFKEVYLPVIIAAAAILLIIVFICGSIVRGIQNGKIKKQASADASVSQAAEEQRLAEECQNILAVARQLADGYDYQGAVTIIDTFTGNLNDYPELSSMRQEYVAQQSTMVAWEDPNDVINLSFQLLIADPARAFSNQVWGNNFKENFITTDEFSNILQQLYENGYILVGLDDLFAVEEAEDGSLSYVSKTLYLPNGKKPLMLTQTNVNYNLYLVDSDGDMIPDKNGGGFASKLILDAAGQFANEMVDGSGQTVTGAYDLVPILDSFIENHPDFSYKGAKAVLALTGYNGLFGYRTHPAGQKKLGEEAYKQAVIDVSQVITQLENSGYTLACYTYENIGYGDSGLAEIQSDLKSWNDEVVPIMQPTDILVYAQKSDISSEKEYSGEKYQALHDAGFHYFLGFCPEGKQQAVVAKDYVRQGRIMVTGKNLADHADWFAPYFDAGSVLDTARTAK